MSEEIDIKKIKESVEEFFTKMTFPVSGIEARASAEADKAVIDLEVRSDEPQILIGQQGQTLFEIQRLLRLMLIKKMQTQKVFYLNLDINDYKKKKIEYLKDSAKELADQAAFTNQEKEFLPMPAYERRIIHAELSQRADVFTESVGEGLERRVVVKPK